MAESKPSRAGVYLGRDPSYLIGQIPVPRPATFIASVFPGTATNIPTEADIRRIVAEELQFAQDRKSILEEYARLTGRRP